MKKLPENFPFLEGMYAGTYYPPKLVDEVRDAIKRVVTFIEEGPHSNEEIQSELDQMTERINDLQDDFLDQDSEIETVARESIGETVEQILLFFEIDIDVETAIGNRDW